MSDATLAQGEEAPEDTENTDHDISAAAESLEPTSDNIPASGIEDIMDPISMDPMVILDRINQRTGEIIQEIMDHVEHMQTEETEDSETPRALEHESQVRL